MKKITLATIAILGFAGATAALADDDGFYVLGGVGQLTGKGDKSLLDDALSSTGATGFTSSLGKPTAYQLQAGYQVNKNLAFEGGYLGSEDKTYSASGGNLGGTVNAKTHVSGWDLTAVGQLPVGNQFSLLGKLGVADMKDDVTGAAGTDSVSGSRTAATYGLGAKYNFTDAAFTRLDVDNYDIGDSSASKRSNIWTVSMGYKF